MDRKEIEKLWNVKLRQPCKEWNGYNIYKIDSQIKPGHHYMLEKDGCTAVISGCTAIGSIFMNNRFWTKRKQAQERKEISPNSVKKVSNRDLAFSAIGILDNELFVIDNYATDSKNPNILAILAQTNHWGPDQGFAELFVVYELKKLGAKHIRYTMPYYPKDAIF